MENADTTKFMAQRVGLYVNDFVFFLVIGFEHKRIKKRNYKFKPPSLSEFIPY